MDNSPFVKKGEASGSMLERLPFIGRPKPLISILDLTGVIGQAGVGRRGLSHARVQPAIDAAFRSRKVKAVILNINSPGGSPVQSRLIYGAIRRAAARRNTPVLAFIEDVGASGGYILALAGDEIYADASSIVGSIGVIAASFGFADAIARFGVERRVHTAGENKSRLDPFKPENPDDVARLKGVLDELHAQFIALVKERRGARLADAPDTFSGDFWTAEGAKARGLIDGTAQLGDFLQARFGKDATIRKYSPDRQSFIRRLFGGGEIFVTLPQSVLDAAAERSAWSKYGL